MSDHTPGPWFAERHGIVTADVGGHRRQVASTTGDAVMHGDPNTNVIELQMANARLIAAAPELLDCLNLAISRCSACGTCGPAYCADCRAARAAIAKATGGAP
jgi:hypothetical protein